MTRSFHFFDCEGSQLAATLDHGDHSTGLLIVSGGNEIRSGAHGGMARLAGAMSQHGYPVFRYDRRGIGESGGENSGYLSSEDDIVRAANHFRSLCPEMDRLVAFGNCDAATALALYGAAAECDDLILANPWLFEEEQSGNDDTQTLSPSTIRSRYWDRLKDPATILDLLKGQIDLRKLLNGLKQASKKQQISEQVGGFFQSVANNPIPIRILLAKRDTTARAFLGSWKQVEAQTLRSKPDLKVQILDTASHSFADEVSRNWLETQIFDVLKDG